MRRARHTPHPLRSQSYLKGGEGVGERTPFHTNGDFGPEPITGMMRRVDMIFEARMVELFSGRHSSNRSVKRERAFIRRRLSRVRGRAFSVRNEVFCRALSALGYPVYSLQRYWVFQNRMEEQLEKNLMK